MPAAAPLARRPLTRLIILLTALVASSAVLVPHADAMSRSTGNRVVHIAATKRGTPYRWGGSGPRSFDCSGYTRWVFAHVGRYLPHNAAAQSRVARHIRRADRRPGDLVFFYSYGHVYLVGIYAGHNLLWEAPRPGRWVTRERIWSNRVFYGRVR
jgi:cell wall-associated NlpC family hydrolase